MRIPVGQVALRDRLNLQVPMPAVQSYVVSGTRRTELNDRYIIESYPKNYVVDDSIVGHLKFALKYEPIDLGVITETLRAIDPSVITEWVRAEPTGAYSRRIWFFYEYFTGRVLDLDPVRTGNYVEALDPEKHVTGERMNSQRHRVINNLLGSPGLNPIVRKTQKLQEYMSINIAEEARKLTESIEPLVLARAISYLYTKETRSSFALEGEAPNLKRTERFISALKGALTFNPCNKDSFIRLQGDIVDPRYAASDWREFQNFVGEIVSGYREEVHFICPRPGDVKDLMQSWMEMTDRLANTSVDPVVASALSAFSFVFIHPFEDGNGRIHRFLIHHILAKKQFSPKGVIFPVSASMLRDRRSYDEALESFSKPLFEFIDWKFNEARELVVSNETGHLYRYFDATLIAEYLYERVIDTVRRDLREELGFMKVYDSAMSFVKEYIDMPDRRASELITYFLQNGGKISNNKRKKFPELSDKEIEMIEGAIAESKEDLADDPILGYAQAKEANQTSIFDVN